MSEEKNKNQFEHYSSWGHFAQNGLQFEAFLPVNGEAKICWKLKVTKDDEIIVDGEEIELLYEPVFGPDPSDIKKLDDRVDEIIAEHSSAN